MQGSTVMRQSGAATLATEEPDAFIAHVRVCGGAGWVTTGSTRKGRGHILPSPIAGHVMKSVSPIDQHSGHIIVLEEFLLVIANHHQDIRRDLC